MIESILRNFIRNFRSITSNTNVTTNYAIFNRCNEPVSDESAMKMATSKRQIYFSVLRVHFAVLVALASTIFWIDAGTASADVRSADIEGVFGTAFEIRPPSAIIVASNSGLVTLNFTVDSDLRIGSNKADVLEIAEGDRVVSTATRNDDGQLVALRTLVRVANAQPITKHVVGVVTGLSEGELSIQTRNGGVVNVLVPAGIDAPLVGDGITMVARLDRSSGILTAVGFELTSKTVERIQDARDKAADQAESDRLAEIAIEARSKHLSALDDAARAIMRVIDSDRTDKETLEKAQSQLSEIQSRFDELKGIYESAARNRGEEQPLLRVSGGLVEEIGLRSFTVVPEGGRDTNPFSVELTYDPDETTVDLPNALLREISRSAINPQLFSDVRALIEPGSELDIKYSIRDKVRTAVSIKVKPPRLVEELEAVLEHESLRAFHGVITLVEIDDSLADAQGIVIAANEKQGVKAAAKVTDQTEITLNGRVAALTELDTGQSVDIQFESTDGNSISDITGSDITLRALAIRARSSVPTEEENISGVVESVDVEGSAISIQPTDGEIITLTVSDDAPIVRNGAIATLGDVSEGDLVVTATIVGSESDQLSSLVVVARRNVKFSGTITGVGQAPERLQVTTDSGQVFNVLVTDETWVIVDDRRVKFESLETGMNIVNGAYSVTGRNGTLYNVATIISIESPKVVKASGIITEINVLEGTLIVLSGRSTETRVINLKVPETPLGENLIKDGRLIRSLLEVERGDRVDMVFYVLETGEIQKLSIVSDNFIQSRGTVVEISENNRFVVVELANGDVFDLWVSRNSVALLNGRRIQSLASLNALMNIGNEKKEDLTAVIPEVLFIRDSIDSNRGVIISINFQVKVDPDDGSDGNDQQNVVIETTLSGVIEAIDGNRWVIDGEVFRVDENTRFQGGTPKVGEVVVAVLVSRTHGDFVARTINISRKSSPISS